MIPMIDDYLRFFLVERLTWLKQHPSVIDHIFYTCRRETAVKLKDFIINQKIRVIIGFPREPSQVPCYCINLAPEQEQPLGFGDDMDYYEGFGLGEEEIEDSTIPEVAERKILQFASSTLMNSNYRIECWSDNGDVSAYLYIILKWCMWSSRKAMFKLGWAEVSLGGSDLEPVPDYMPMFIYRRALNMTLKYENIYYEELEKLEPILAVLDNPKDYHKDIHGNVCSNATKEIVIPMSYTWMLKGHYLDGNTNTWIVGQEKPTDPKEEILYKYEED